MQSQCRQKFRTAWTKLPQYANWLLPVDGDPTRAWCKYCKNGLNAKLTTINNHLKIGKYAKAAAPFAQSFRQTKLDFKKASRKTAFAEGKLARYVAVHSAILSIDHLGTLCKNTFDDAEAARGLKIHRTKCSNIIKCVLYPLYQNNVLRSGRNFTSRPLRLLYMTIV